VSEVPVLYAVDGKVATVTLNRPQRRNAMNYDMCIELHSAMLRAAQDPAISVIVLTGAGDSFCVGVDVGTMGKAPEHAAAPAKRMVDVSWPQDARLRPDYQGPHSYFPSIEKPIISMINGSAAGLGLIYACFSDLRFCAEDAVLASAFVRRGLPIEWGMAWLLPKLMGSASAFDFLISGRKLTAAQAQAACLVNRAIPRDRLAEETYTYAAEIATWCPPHALRLAKLQLWESYHQTLEQSSRMFLDSLDGCLRRDDYKEAVSSFMEKRVPNFRGR
jgi:enoyl-CoA hydratase/carnithine racemase